MPPKKQAAAAAAAASAPATPAPAPAPTANGTAAHGASPSTRKSPAKPATPGSNHVSPAAKAAAPPPFEFAPPQNASELTLDNSLFFTVKAIFHYLSQFGFGEAALTLKNQVADRFPEPDDTPLSRADEQESEIRLCMYQVFTMTAEAAPGLSEAGEVLLDSLAVLATFARIPRTVDSPVFDVETQVRVCACLDGAEDPEVFAELLQQYFRRPEEATGEGAGVALLPSAAEVQSIKQRVERGSRVSDSELRKKLLFELRAQLEAYAQAQAQLAKLKANSSAAKAPLATIAHFESTYTRARLQESAQSLLKGLMSRLKVAGPVWLETVTKELVQHGRYVVRPDEPVEEEEQEEAEAEEEEEEQQEEEEEAEEQAEEEEEEEEPAAAAPAPTPAAVPGRKRGRPSKAELAARAAASSSSAAAASPVALKARAAAASKPAAAVSEVARKLQAASEKLKNQGQDPLAESLRATQQLSKKRKSIEPKEEEEEEEDVPVEEEEEEEEEVRPRRRGGRPAKASKVAKYDRADPSAEKIRFDDDVMPVAAFAESSSDDEAAAPVALPSFTTKKQRVLDKSGSAASPKPAAASARATQMSSSSDDPSQRNRPAVHRHTIDRSVRRVPWSTEEIQKLTDGVVEFASERKKWSLILQKYGEFFQDRTVVDLKDKWRNLKGKLGAVVKRKQRAAESEGEEVEEIEE